MNRVRWLFPFGIINIFLIENLLKTYDIPFANDKIRLICYSLLGAMSGLFILYYLYQQKGIVNTKRVSFAVVIYYICTLAMLFMHSNITSEILLLCSMVPFAFFISYYGFLNSNKTEEIIRVQCIIFVVVWLLFMYNKLFLHQAGAGKLNSVFYVVLLLPFILSLDNQFWVKVLMGFMMVAVVFSMKRTAVVIVVLAVLAFLWFKDSHNRARVVKIAVALLVMLLAIVVIQNRIGIDIIGKFEAMSEDGGSGRAGMYSVLLGLVFDRSPFQFLFGDGYYAVINIIGETAHNDFLEILFDFGLFGFILYLFIYFCLLKSFISMKRLGYKYCAQFLVSIIIFGIMSMLSHVIMIPSYMMYICMFWGLILADFEQWRFKGDLPQ